MLLLSLQWAGIVYSWSDPHVYGTLIGASLALALYFIYQGHQGDKSVSNPRAPHKPKGESHRFLGLLFHIVSCASGMCLLVPALCCS